MIFESLRSNFFYKISYSEEKGYSELFGEIESFISFCKLCNLEIELEKSSNNGCEVFSFCFNKDEKKNYIFFYFRERFISKIEIKSIFNYEIDREMMKHKGIIKFGISTYGAKEEDKMIKLIQIFKSKIF